MSAPAPRVLIADDQALVRAGFRMIFASDGIEVVGEAVNGVEAVQAVRRVRPDVVLMDIRLPELDGLEATRRMVERFARPEAPGVAAAAAHRDLAALTPRELEVLTLVAGGSSNAELAGQLHVSEATAKTHWPASWASSACATGCRRSSSRTRPAWSAQADSSRCNKPANHFH